MTLLVIAKVTFIFSLSWLALLGMRGTSAALRHTVVVISLLTALLVPAFEFALPSWHVLPRLESSEARDIVPAIETSQAAVSVPKQTLPAPVTRLIDQTSSHWSFGNWLLRFWFVGSLILVSVLLYRVFAMRATVWRAERIHGGRWASMLAEACAKLGIKRRVQIRVRAKGTMPAVWGIFSPVILLPRDCIRWSNDRCRDVLAHELAHVARRDVLSILMGHLVCALHWFNPFVWVLKRRMTIESECACDDLALEQGVPATRYAENLLQIAADSQLPHSLAPVMAARTQLEERIMAILETNRSRNRNPARAQLLLASLAMSVLIPISSLTWAQIDEAKTETADSSYSNSVSDSAEFAKHLNEIGIARDDIDALLLGLTGPDPLTRAASAWALGDSSDPRIVAPLVQSGYDSDAIVRQWAVRSLAPWIQSSVAALLIDRLQDSDAETRQWAARSLDNHDPDVKAQPLIQVLGDSDAEVREWSVRALANVDDAFVRAALADRFTLERNADVNEWLVRTLGGNSADSVDALIQATSSSAADVRQWAVRGLSGNRDDRVVNVLISMLGDADAEVREWSVRGLGVCGNERAVAPLEAMRADSSADVREWADRSLESIDCTSKIASR